LYLNLPEVAIRLCDAMSLPSFLEFGEVPSDFAVFSVLGDESEGFERVEAVLDLGFTAGGVFELGRDRIQAPFPSLCPQEVTDGGELVFEVFGPGLLGDGRGDWDYSSQSKFLPISNSVFFAW
jgi:hypothetical protein